MFFYCRDVFVSHKGRESVPIFLWISPIPLQAGGGQRDLFVEDYFGQQSNYRTGIITILVFSELNDNMYTTVINIVHVIM